MFIILFYNLQNQHILCVRFTCVGHAQRAAHAPSGTSAVTGRSSANIGSGVFVRKETSASSFTNMIWARCQSATFIHASVSGWVHNYPKHRNFTMDCSGLHKGPLFYPNPSFYSWLCLKLWIMLWILKYWISVISDVSSILLLLLLKKIGNARPGEGDWHPISPKTPTPHYQPIEEKKRKGK